MIKFYLQMLLDIQIVYSVMLFYQQNLYLHMDLRHRVYVNPYAAQSQQSQPTQMPVSQPTYQTQNQPQQSYSIRYSDQVNRNVQYVDSKQRISYQSTNMNPIQVTRQATSYGPTNTVTAANEVKNDNTGNEQKQKFKQVSQDLAKLKRKLENIVIHDNSSQVRVNKSLDRYYNPNSREGEVKVQRVYARVVPRAPGQNLNESMSNITTLKPQTTRQVKVEKPQIRSYQPKIQQNTYTRYEQPRIEHKVQLKTQNIKIQTKVEPKIEAPRVQAPRVNNFQQKQQRRVQRTVQIPPASVELKRIQTQPSQGINYARTLNSYNRYSPYPSYEPLKKQLPNLQTEPSLASASNHSRSGSELRFQSSFSTNQNISNDSILMNSPTKSYVSTSEHQRVISQFQRQKRQLLQKLDGLQVQKRILAEQKQNLKQRIQNQQSKRQSLQTKYHQVSCQYEECKIREKSYKERIQILERDLANTKNRGKNSFEDVLRDQLEQSRKIKQMVDEKNDQINKLKDAVTQNRRRTQQAVNQVNIQRLKYVTQKRQMQQLQQIIILNKDNQIKSLKHALQTMQSRLQMAIKDNKSKDQFMQQHLVGRIKQGEQKQYVNRFMQRYQINFPVNNLKQKLMQQQRQIQRLSQIIFEKQGSWR